MGNKGKDSDTESDSDFESLNLVASLKGVRGERREVFKRLIMQNLDLTPFKQTLAKNLSGGNKRKLCCA